MPKPNEGGTAFPVPGSTPGMSLRDYFAAKALMGIMSHPTFPDLGDYDPLAAAREAYEMADAMLKAREAVFRGNQEPAHG